LKSGTPNNQWEINKNVKNNCCDQEHFPVPKPLSVAKGYNKEKKMEKINVKLIGNKFSKSVENGTHIR